jgi:hypothetical protein
MGGVTVRNIELKNKKQFEKLVQLGRFIIKNNCEESYCNLQNVFAVATKE